MGLIIITIIIIKEISHLFPSYTAQFNKANLSKPSFQDSLALREIWKQLPWLS